MKVKSARAFRTLYKTTHKMIPAHDRNYDEHFVGTYHDTAEKQRIKGFFEMYHGDKPNIAGYLPSILKIAEDGQAIYEFLQNAVDCGSTECLIFYNDLYFLAINNGKPFINEELESLFNIAQSPKKDADKIGRFGVGFKLIHRLVGKSDGVDELVKEYRGPVLFSWQSEKDLISFLEKEEIVYDNNFAAESDLPILLKILLTNFPANIEETVKDLDYKDQVVFSMEELLEMQDFVNSSLSGLHQGDSLSCLSSGSLFFIKLGEGKRELLDRDYNDLVKGIQFSMNTLKRLEKVYINNTEINRFPLVAEEFEVGTDTEAFRRISPEYKDYPIKIMFGHSDIKESEIIKLSPNFYKYFPMGDEVNGFSFILHSDGFSNEVNRRKLQQDPINKNLLPAIGNLLIERMDLYKSSDIARFLQIYGNVLLSDIPDKQNNDWLRPIFYDRLLDYLRTNIPTNGRSFCLDCRYVKINDMRLDMNLCDAGLGDYNWFIWNTADHKNLSKEAEEHEKLNIERWDVRDILEQADLFKLNTWIEDQSESEYNLFLKEIERGEKELRKDTIERLKEIELFKFSDGCFYSFRDALENTDLIFNFERTIGIKDILESLGLVTSCLDISAHKRIYEKVFNELHKSENKLYESIALKCRNNTLSADAKKRLFNSLVSDETGFHVSDHIIRETALFADQEGRVKPLGQLIRSRLQTPEWLNPYKISSNEYFDTLEGMLLEEERIYSQIIVPNLDEIKPNIDSVVDFYEKVVFYCSIDDSHESFNKQEVIFVDKETGYVGSDDIFFNSALSEMQLYEEFGTAIRNLTGKFIPDRKILPHLTEEPFELSDSSLLKYSLDNDVSLTKNEIRSLLNFCRLTGESFFDIYIIVKENKSYRVLDKTKETFQVRISNRYRKIFTEHFGEMFYILPQELDEYRDTNGIVQREELSLLLTEMVDIDEYKEELAGIISSDESKKYYLEKLSSLNISTERDYCSDDYEYKVLDWASQLMNEKELKEFREKVFIETQEGKYVLTAIPPLIDKIYISGVELSLSKIFPETYGTVGHLSLLEEKFKSIGPRLGKVLGIKQEDYEEHFNTLVNFELTELNDGGRGIENTEQLVFIALFLDSRDSEASHLYVRTEEEKFLWKLSGTFYIKHYSFIQPQRILDSQHYSALNTYWDFLSKLNGDEFSFLEKPIVSGNVLECIGFKDELTDDERKDFFSFLYDEWINPQTKLPSVHWNEMDATESIFGCKPWFLVYPEEYAEKCEILPSYLKGWLIAKEIAEEKSFISFLSVNGEDSDVVKLRKSLANDSDFNLTLCSDIPSEMLLNTLKWLEQKGITISTPNGEIIFTKIVDILDGEAIQVDLYDVDDLHEKSTELEGELYNEWKEVNGSTIFLHDGPMNGGVTIDEIGDYVFYQTASDIVIIDSYIYINKEINQAKALQLLGSSSKIDIDIESLLPVFSTNPLGFEISDTEIELLKVFRTIPPTERDAYVLNLKSHLASAENGPGEYDSLKRTSLNPGDKGEQIVKKDLEKKFGEDRVRWTSSKNPFVSVNDSTDEYDFEVYDESRDNVIYYVDSKSTIQKKYQGSETDIIWKNSEWRFIEDVRPDNYVVARVFGCNTGKPEITYLSIKAIELCQAEDGDV